MRVGYYQFNPQFGNLAENRKQIKKALLKVDADLIVLPELPVSGYFFSDKEEAASLAESVPGPTTKILQSISAQTGTYFIKVITKNKILIKKLILN